MKILVFDTCFNKLYVVLSYDGEIIENRIVENTEKNYHSVFLIPQIQDILKSNNILIKDIDAIGVDIGPGSFTGIRAGVTIARVLAQQTDIKLIGVPSLQILSKINNTPSRTIIITDARKNKVYFGVYQAGNELEAPKLINKDEIINHIATEDYIISDLTIKNFLSEQGFNAQNYEEDDTMLGLYLAEIVYNKLKNKTENFHWAKVKPLYIQAPSITKSKEVKNV